MSSQNKENERSIIIETESKIREIVQEFAKLKGIKSERALRLISDLVLAFLNSITDLPKTDLIEEWKLVAFRAKMPPVCKHPCQFSSELEKVLMRAGFRNIHYHLIITALDRLSRCDKES
ncbi:MAG: hypothetical protein DRO05_08540 [Thermoproteota archaeon]|nr:MAG: hypothetical protein DRO05_08540 [Candidatus Korarchaeota archaeon]